MLILRVCHTLIYDLHPSDKPGYAVNDNGEYVRYTVFNDKVTIVK